MKRLVLATLSVLVLSVAAAAGVARPAVHPSMRDIGTLGGTYSEAVAVSDSGLVVGTSTTTDDLETHAFAWTAKTGMVDIGTLGGGYSRAIAVNNGGLVVGYSYTRDGFTHAFAWTARKGMVDLDAATGTSSIPAAVNNSGLVVGSAYVSDGIHAFAWSATSGMTDLGTLGGSNSGAVAVNDAGLVVGGSFLAGGAIHAFEWTKTKGMVDLGSLGGVDAISFATAVSNSGRVVGFSATTPNNADAHAFETTKKAGMTDLGSFQDANSEAVAVNGEGLVAGRSGDEAVVWNAGSPPLDIGLGQAFAVNDRGVVVGYSSVPDEGRLDAFAWTSTNGMVDLGTLGGPVSAAVAVNDQGLAVGYGFITDAATNSNLQHAVVWQL